MTKEISIDCGFEIDWLRFDGGAWYFFFEIFVDLIRGKIEEF